MEGTGIKKSNSKYTQEVKELLTKYNTGGQTGRQKYYEMLFKRNSNKLLTSMMALLENEIENYSFDCESNEASYLFSLLEVLPDTINNNNNLLRQSIVLSLDKLIMDVDRLLHMNEENINYRYKMLQRIRIKLGDRKLKLSNDIPFDYNSSKEDFISYLIFQEKNIHYVSNAIKDDPYIVNITDKKNTPLIFNVLKAYLRALDKYTRYKNLGPIDDLIYYKDVIKLLINSEKISLNNEDKRKLMTKLSDHLKNTNYEVIRQKEKHTYFINCIIMMLLGKDEEDNLDSLNYEYEVHETFKQTHQLEANRIYILHDNLKGKTNKQRIYTFDGEGAKEIDDALSIEKKNGVYHLGVHIANPLAYIPTDSILYDEAGKRTRTLYFGNGFIPMYPELLATNTMSLNEGEYRYAMSHYFDIDALSGELIKYEPKAETIMVTKNLTYNKFNQDVIHGTDDEEYMETLYNLCEIAPILGRVYHEDSTYHEFHNDNSRTLATSVVEKCMIYTNHMVAKRFSDEGLPFPYRCHIIDEKQRARIDQIKEKMASPENSKYMISENKHAIRELEMLRSIFPRAYYTTKNVGHMGLGTTYYSHVTSPLRRFADNLATECIYRFILNQYTNEDIKKVNEKIEQSAEYINAKRKSLDNYEIERMRRRLK